MPSVGELFVKVGADLSGLRGVGRRVQRALEPVSRISRQTGAALSAGLTAPLVLLGRRAVQSAVEIDSLRRGLTAVAGSSQKAEVQFKRLREVAKLPGLSFKDAVQGSINLQAAGLSAELAERALSSVGNALATVGRGAEDLAGVNLALTQIASKTKISAEEINQLAERIPQIRQVLISAFGTASTEAISKLGKTSREVLEEIIVGLEKLPRVAGGIGNDFENASQAIDEAFQAIGAAILPIISNVLEKVVPVITKITAAFQALPFAMQENIVIFGALLAALGPLALAFSALLSPIGLTITAIAAVVASAKLLIDNWQAVGAFFGRLWTNIKVIFVTVSAQIVGTVKGFFIIMAEIFTTGVSNLIGIFKPLAERLGFDEFATKIEEIQQAVKDFIPDDAIADNNRKLEVLQEAASTAFNNIKNDVVSVKNNVVDTVKEIGAALAGAFNGVFTGGAGRGAPAVGGPARVAGAGIQDSANTTNLRAVLGEGPGATGAITEGMLKANSAASEFATILDTSFSGLLDLQEPIAAGFQVISDGIGIAAAQAFSFKGNFDGIKTAVVTLGDVFKNFFRELIAGFARAIAKALILRALTAAIGGATGGGGFFAGVLRSFGGFRADGGPVSPGKSFIVGEKGAEIFTPRTSGQITPISGAGQGGAIPIAITATSVAIPGDQLLLVVEQAQRNRQRSRGF